MRNFFRNITFIRKKKIFLKIYNLIYDFFILFFDKERTIKFYNYKICVNLRDYLVSRRIFLTGSFNIKVEKYLLNHIKKKMFVVDAGANIGALTILISHKVGTNGKVIAFEPDKRNIKFLKKNIKLNSLKNVDLYPFILSDNSKEKLFYLDKNYYGSSTILKSELPTNLLKKSKTKSVTLDHIISKNYKKIDFIKVNIEGSEVPFLKGAIKTIKKYKPDILLEYSFSRLSKIKKFNNEKFFSLFRKLNYKVYPIGYHKKFYSNNQLKKISLHHDRDNLGVLHLIMEKT